jgi:hypothetical protein
MNHNSIQILENSEQTNELDVQLLISWGFNREKSISALEKFQNNSESALQFLQDEKKTNQISQ